MKKEGKNLMIVGTASGVGKSTVVAGLCRVFKNRNYRVFPFKSQNMALNSYVTKDGYEMGRAQVIQAYACGLEPDVIMNPILLKPSGNNKIQVILNGKVFANMTGREYNEFKENLIPMLEEIYSNISKYNDLIFIEGAGSPAEINLEYKDISNFEMARIADAPVILVADIDRGGVFASIYGTIMLMKEEERKRIKGIIINKFRGDKIVLQKGIEKIENLTGVKTLGVLPYHNLNIEEEDSLTEKKQNTLVKNKKIKILIINLKHISNTTDFNVFNLYDDIEMKFTYDANDFVDEDIIIIPGSKNTIDDMIFLRENKLDLKIIEAAKKGKIIIGICGGFQLLGKKIYDTSGIESDILDIDGIGLLDIETEMSEKKYTKQYTGEIQKSLGFFDKLIDRKISGYEIHHGISHGNIKNLTCDNRLIIVNKKNIIGTYLHGFFDNDNIRKYILDKVLRKKGLGKIQKVNYQKNNDIQLEKLEKIILENVDLEYMERIINGDV